MQVNERVISLKKWLNHIFSSSNVQFELLSGDASFRRYFRVYNGTQSFVAMDAPPQQESCAPFVAIAKAFKAVGLNTPEIYDADVNQGFLLLADFGDQLYLNALNQQTADRLYHQAFSALLQIAKCQQFNDYTLPRFDAKLYLEELNLFRDWYLQGLLGVELSQDELQTLTHTYQLLINAALNQPQVCVHRDYHSRNLMVLPKNEVGILDFQDAVWGPVTYDILSLLRDCYIDWPEEQVIQWALQYQRLLLTEGLLSKDDPQQFLRWFDWIGLQRNLKCIGIFSRLHLRDNKSGYLQDIPRVVRYADRVCGRYPEFAALKGLLQKYVVAHVEKR